MEIFVDWQAPQSSHAGRLALNLNSNMKSLLSHCRQSIYHGGTHGFTIQDTKENVLSWLDLLKQDHPECSTQIDAVLKEIASGKNRIFCNRLKVVQDTPEGPEEVDMFHTEQQWDRHGGWKKVKELSD